MKTCYARCKNGVDNLFSMIKVNSVEYSSSESFLYYYVLPNIKLKILFQETNEGLDLYMNSLLISKMLFLRLKKYDENVLSYKIKINEIYKVVLLLPLVVLIPASIVWFILLLLNTKGNVFIEIIRTEIAKKMLLNYFFTAIIIYLTFPINKLILMRRVKRIFSSVIEF